MNLLATLRAAFDPILAEYVPDASERVRYLAMIKPAQATAPGDYQANFAMALAKPLGRRPAEIATEVAAKIASHPMMEPPEVAGPGFINIRLRNRYLADAVSQLGADERLGVAPAELHQRFVIDYSGPNVAKPLHVGHLRSTIIGESLARILRFLGHRVIADNHLGDWGTQFGILLYGYKHYLDHEAYKTDPVRELARLYVHIRQLTTPGKVNAIDEDEAEKLPLAPEQKAIVEAYRQETVKLHQGDAENVALWREFMPHCMAEIHAVYQRLDVRFDHEMGESFYQPMLAGIVEELLASGIAEYSQGAVVIPGSKDYASMIRKTDGAFTYTTTDLATIRYRVDLFKPDAILYVVDFRQGDHFKHLFAAARKWGYDQVELTHIVFGSVLGPDGKPLKSRDGGVPELNDLLNEACAVGYRRYIESREERRANGHEVPEIPEIEERYIAQVVGTGAVKYADLSQNRTTDYKYIPDKFTAPEGNTATYMQYAYARCRNIFRKGEIDPTRFRSNPPAIFLIQPEERVIALQLLRASEAFEAAASEYQPHVIAGYLFELTQAMSRFYASENCNVLKAEGEGVRDSRLLLVDLISRMIRLCLELLGIHTLERM